jgi:RsiW-degrading membrane proteinase PrsW (M82 family)
VRGLAILCVFAIGCGAPLGTDDVELAYRFAADPLHDTAAAVRDRLEAGRINADVELDGTNLVRIRLAADHALFARRLLEWSGHLEVYAADPKHQIAGAEAHGLSWAGDRYTGDDDDLLAAAIAVHDDSHRLVASRGRDEVVQRSPIAMSSWFGARVDGTVVTVALSAAARAALADRDDNLLVVAGSIVVARGHVAKWIRDLDGVGPVLVVPYGEDLRAYQRARRLADVLESGELPALALVSSEDAPADWLLALGAAGIPLVTGLLWVGFVRRFDRMLPEPLWLVLATFLLGVAAQRVAGFIEIHAWTASAYLDPAALAKDHRASAFPLSYLVCVLVVGVVEEGAKLLATVPALRRREFDEPIDGMIYSAAAAIGFAIAENVDYFTAFRLDDAMTVTRSLHTIPVHVLLSCVWGYALGQRLVGQRRRTRLAIAFAIAALAHGAVDTFLDFGVRHGDDAVNVALAVGFAAMVRRSLQWGRAPDAVTGPRVLIRVGRPVGAAMAFATMIAMAYLMRLHATAASADAQRLTVELAARGGLLGVVFVAAAFALVRLLPLDVAIDDGGVTYAGARHAWPDIRGCTRRGMHVVLETAHGVVRLGPGKEAALDELVRQVASRGTSPGDSATGA